RGDPAVPRSVRPSESILGVLRELAGVKGHWVALAEASSLLGSRGFTPAQIGAALDEYEELNVLQVNPARTRVTFV
ncbi:MCM7 factor, partial [Neodrepanis coruscans]|nr:MCM7 factor [Neodrepanis coruscans]